MTRSDDPRLTAYLVDDVDEEASAAVEQALDDSAEARQAAEEIRAAARLLSHAFASEPVPLLRPEQRHAVEQEAWRRADQGARAAGLAPWLGLAAAAVCAGIWLLHDGVGRPAGAPRLPGAAAPAGPALPAEPASAAAEPPAMSRKPAPAPMPPAAAPDVEQGPALVTLRGVVRGPRQAVLPGATVVARSLATGLTLQVRSGPRGEFEIAGIPAGAVELRAELAGFEATREQLAPSGGTLVSWDPVLGAAQASRGPQAADAAAPPVAAPSAAPAEGAAGPRVAAREPGRPPAPPPGRVLDAGTPARGVVFAVAGAGPGSASPIGVDASVSERLWGAVEAGRLPAPATVRADALVNAFLYGDPAPREGEALAARVEIAPAPWHPLHLLARISLRARDVERAERPPGSLVLLVDVSESMHASARLTLATQGLRTLVDGLTSQDRVAVVAYAGPASTILDAVAGDNHAAIRAALQRLHGISATEGGGGLEAGYDAAQRYFAGDGNNQVILVTDGRLGGDRAERQRLLRLVRRQARAGVSLNVLGVGPPGGPEAALEALARAGSGSYARIDSERAAQAALAAVTAPRVVVARNVSVRVSFDGRLVREHWRIGAEDEEEPRGERRDDAALGGDMLAGQTVTALYEIVPKDPGLAERVAPHDLLQVSVEYTDPEGRRRHVALPTVERAARVEAASADFQFAAAVAAFGMLLSESRRQAGSSYGMVEELARQGRGEDALGQRGDFLRLVERVRSLPPPAP